MATTRFQRRVRLGGRLRPGRGLRAGSRLRVGPHALAQRMLEGLLYLALLLYLLLLLFLLVLFQILLFIFRLCASSLSTRQAKIDRLPALACCKVAVDACFLSSRIYYAGSGRGLLTRPSSSTTGLPAPNRWRVTWRPRSAEGRLFVDHYLGGSLGSAVEAACRAGIHD